MELQGAYRDIRAQGAELLAISVDSVADARRMADYAGADFPVLADEDRGVAQAYGVFDLLRDGVSAPATLIIDRNGALAATHVGSRIDDRVSTGTILEFLRQLNGDRSATSS